MGLAGLGWSGLALRHPENPIILAILVLTISWRKPGAPEPNRPREYGLKGRDRTKTRRIAMNPLLQEAFNSAAALPSEEQDRFARFLLAELEADPK